MAGPAFAGERSLTQLPSDQRLEVRFGAGAVMGDHLGRRDRADPQRVFEAALLGAAGKEAGGEEIAGAGGVDDPGHRLGRDLGALAARDRDRALLAARHDQRLDLVLHRGDRGVEIGHAGKRADLRLVGEEDVDLAAVDQRVEAVAVAIDAEAVGEGEAIWRPARGRCRSPDHRVRGISGSHR